jgi:hypothetical protein
MPRYRILTRRVHGNYLYYLTQARGLAATVRYFRGVIGERAPHLASIGGSVA